MRDNRPSTKGSGYARTPIPAQPQTPNIYDLSGAPASVRAAARQHAADYRANRAPSTVKMQPLPGSAFALPKWIATVGAPPSHTTFGGKQYPLNAGIVQGNPEIATERILGSSAARRAPGAIRKVVTGVQSYRTPEEAAAHLKDANKAALREGFGVAKPSIPKVEPGTAPEETGGEHGAQIRKALAGTEDLPSAKAARKEQKTLQSEELSRRVGKAAGAMEQQEGGVASYHAALNQLGGELPKLNWGGFSHFTPDAVESLAQHIKARPDLQLFQKTTAVGAIKRAVEKGIVPTKSEEKLLGQIFGREAAANISEGATFWQKAHRLGQEALLLPRALKASADLSGMFRQDLLLAVSHPRMFARQIPGMARSAVSESHFQAAQQKILTNPLRGLHAKGGVPYTNIGESGTAGVKRLEKREEQFASNLAEKLNLRNIPGLEGLGKAGTGPGDIVRASDRGYTGLLNQSRQVLYDHLLQQAALNGEDLHDPKVLKALGSVTGVLTGRGELGPGLEKHAVTLNALLFSPRYLQRSLNVLGFGGRKLGGVPGLIPGSYYANLRRSSPTAFAEALRSVRNFAATAGAVLFAAKMAGAHVSADPTSADFGKIRVGNTRIDIFVGLQQPVKAAFQEFLQRETSTTTGKTTHLGGSGYNAVGRLDPAWKFISAKASPVPGLALQEAGLTNHGAKQTPGAIAQNLFEPLAIADAISTGSLPAGALAYLLSGTGLGIQNYAPRKPKGTAGKSDTYGGATGGYGGTGYGGGGSVYANGG